MNNLNQIEQLYLAISNDLKISKYEQEPENLFKNRLVYSGLAYWVMNLFLDRDFEDEDIEKVSKSHVTLSAKDVLASYKKLDPNLDSYFTNDLDFINSIEAVYSHLGLINSGNYTFKTPSKAIKLKIVDKVLAVNLKTSARSMRGLGIWLKFKPEDKYIDINDFLLTKIKAIDTFKTMETSLRYEPFSPEQGKIQIYNVEKRHWDFYNDKILQSYKYFILKIDNGLDYKILKINDGNLYAATLPAIYSHKISDFNFEHEIWRIILGLCAFNNKPAKAYLSSIYGNGLKLKVGGYILPALENSIFKCMCWPLNSYNNINEFVTDPSMKEAIKFLLKQLSIEVVEE